MTGSRDGLAFGLRCLRRKSPQAESLWTIQKSGWFACANAEDKQPLEPFCGFPFLQCLRRLTGMASCTKLSKAPAPTTFPLQRGHHFLEFIVSQIEGALAASNG